MAELYLKLPCCQKAMSLRFAEKLLESSISVDGDCPECSARIRFEMSKHSPAGIYISQVYVPATDDAQIIADNNWWCVSDYFNSMIIIRTGVAGSNKGEDTIVECDSDDDASKLWGDFNELQVQPVPAHVMSGEATA